MTRIERINVLTAKLRDLCEQNADRRMAEHFGIAVEDLDEYDPRIGTSIRDLDEYDLERGIWYRRKTGTPFAAYEHGRNYVYLVPLDGNTLEERESGHFCLDVEAFDLKYCRHKDLEG